MKHFLSIDDIDKNSLENLFIAADKIEDIFGVAFPNNCGKTLTSFFGEPSTRTRLSFERGMHWLGGKVITAADASVSSSIAKGESWKDTFRTLSQYSDLIVCRHSDEKWTEAARKYSRVPVINAGNGGGEHPTQALLDLYTIKKELGSIQGKTVLLCGDLKFGRTVHSLIKLLELFECTIILCPASINYSPEMEFVLLPDNNKLSIISREEARYYLPTIDVVYMTRIQTERLQATGVVMEKHFLKLDKELLNTMKPASVVLHPLPRNEELSEEVDDDPRAAYHERQIRNGLYIRIALMDRLLR